MYGIGAGREFEGLLRAKSLRDDNGRGPKPHLTVMFTTRLGTPAALEAAGRLAQGLDASLTLLLPQVVPYALPLMRPPVDLHHVRRAALSLLPEICLSAGPTTVQICLCRSRRECWSGASPPGSLILIGGRNSWWRRSEKRLARRMRALGYEVVFVSAEEGRNA